MEKAASHIRVPGLGLRQVASPLLPKAGILGNLEGISCLSAHPKSSHYPGYSDSLPPDPQAL